MGRLPRAAADGVLLAATARRRRGGRRVQPQAVYDALLADLAPELGRRSPPEDVGLLPAAFPDGLTTAEVAEILASGAALERDEEGAEDPLIGLAACEGAIRVPAGDDALWAAGRRSRRVR